MNKKLNVSEIAMIAMDHDAKLAVAQLILYFESTYRNFKFSSIEDKKFYTLIKTLIKNPDEFKSYIKMINVDFTYLIKLLSFVIPEVFTHNLVKQIRTVYLNKSPKAGK